MPASRGLPRRSGSSIRARARRIRPKETLPQMRQVFRRDATAVILDFDHNRLGTGMAADFNEAAANTMRGIRPGDPANPGTVCGPVISDRQRSRVLGYIDSARADGGRVSVRKHARAFTDAQGRFLGGVELLVQRAQADFTSWLAEVR